MLLSKSISSWHHNLFSFDYRFQAIRLDATFPLLYHGFKPGYWLLEEPQSR
jgi:hypothetical protein